MNPWAVVATDGVLLRLDPSPGGTLKADDVAGRRWTHPWARFLF
jgi:hypothetical protein